MCHTLLVVLNAVDRPGFHDVLPTYNIFELTFAAKMQNWLITFCYRKSPTDMGLQRYSKESDNWFISYRVQNMRC